MLSGSKMPIVFWADAVATAFHVLNRSLINKHQKKTPYEVIFKRKPNVGYFKIFGCPCVLLRLSETTNKFDEKGDEGYFIGYSSSQAAYRVYNKRTQIIQETIQIEWLEENQTDSGNGPNWFFD